jgi:F-type H+-transporting ATPase subunit delta
VTGSLGRRYARALLALARDERRLEEAGAELAAATAAFDDERLREVVLNPGIAASVRRDLTGRVVGALRLSKTTGNLIRLLAARDRLAFLSDVSRAYQDLLDRELGRVRVVIRSAQPLSEDDRQRLEELAKGLARKDVLVSTEVVPELLGGVTLDVGGMVYDGSVQTQLVRVSRAMALGSH